MQVGDRVYFHVPPPDGYPPDKWVYGVHGTIWALIGEGFGFIANQYVVELGIADQGPPGQFRCLQRGVLGIFPEHMMMVVPR